MGEIEVNRDIEALSTKIRFLEDKANITASADTARKDGSPDKLKTAYFSVTNTELRKQLITTTGLLDRLYLKKCELEVLSAREEVSKAVDKSKKQPWSLAAASWIAPVVIGQWIYGFFGAVIGALAGYILSEWVISVIKKEDSKEIEQTKQLLALALRRNEESKIDPFLFSTAEMEACNIDG